MSDVKRAYRARNGMVLGICKGLGEHIGIDALWVRLFAVGALLFTGFWPVLLFYFIMAFLMPKEPMRKFDSEEQEDFYSEYSRNRSQAVGRLKRIFDKMDCRLRRLEDVVTSKEFNWNKRMQDK